MAAANKTNQPLPNKTSSGTQMKAQSIQEQNKGNQSDINQEKVGHLNGQMQPTGAQIVGFSGFHTTQEGAPDRRFAENRILSPEEAEIQKAIMVLKKAGITKIE